MTKAMLLGATLFSVSGAAFAQDAAMTIVENGQSATNFTTLVSVANAAGLTETLMGPGPYTVFARQMTPLRLQTQQCWLI